MQLKKTHSQPWLLVGGGAALGTAKNRAAGVLAVAAQGFRAGGKKTAYA